jgi:hypothetical protein
MNATSPGEALPRARAVTSSGVLACSIVPTTHFPTDSQARAIDGAVDEDIDVGVPILDEDIGHVAEADKDTTAIADSAALTILISEMHPHARDMVAEAAQREVEPFLQAGLRSIIYFDALTSDVELHDVSPGVAWEIGDVT